MRAKPIPISFVLAIFCVPSTGCTNTKESNPDNRTSANELDVQRDMLNVASGPAVKLFPYYEPPGGREPKGLISGKRPENAATGETPLAALAAAAVRCGDMTIIIHTGTSNSWGFISFPSLNIPENKNHEIDLELVSCVQKASEYDFIASIIPPKTPTNEIGSEMAEWNLGEISGDIDPFRSLHAQTH